MGMISEIRLELEIFNDAQIINLFTIISRLILSCEMTCMQIPLAHFTSMTHHVITMTTLCVQMHSPSFRLR